MIIARKLKTKSFTGRDLVERLYSDGWTIEQREFGKFSNIRELIKRHGVKRTYKKLVGEKRKSIADKVARSMRNDVARNIKANRSLSRMPIVTDQEFHNKVIQEANKRRIGVSHEDTFAKLTGHKGGNFIEHNLKPAKRMLRKFKPVKDPKNTLQETIQQVQTNDKMINLNTRRGENSHIALHEVGHDEARKKPISGIVAFTSKFFKKRFKRPLFKNKVKGGPISFSKDYVGKKLIVKNEQNAWKEGSKIADKLGIISEKRSVAKVAEDLAVETYKSTGDAKMKESIYKAIQIPSRAYNKNSVFPDSKTRKRMWKKNKRGN
jgi:hypothetical protein